MLASVVLLHEWAHFFQDPTVIAGEPGAAEGGAELFARTAWRQLFLPRHKGEVRFPPFAPIAVARSHGWDWVLRGQFGVNYGVNPQTL